VWLSVLCYNTSTSGTGTHFFLSMLWNVPDASVTLHCLIAAGGAVRGAD
jgi:hypothetical protein